MSAPPGSLLERLEEIERRGLEALHEAEDGEALERARVEFLGRSGALSEALGRIGGIPEDERPAVGRTANRVKRRLQEAHERRAAELREAGGPSPAGELDLTLPGRQPLRGGLHPVTAVIEEICAIFREIGFSVAAGPEIETDWYNFTALNTPLDHPAADLNDTFYLAEGVLLRSHTSPVQIRTLQAHGAPVRILAPGRVYRRDPWDPSHAPAFEQIEGLAVDEAIDFIEFKADIGYFVRRFFGSGTKTRFRPSYFPFTEPSAEVDVTCVMCDGSGCPTCKGTGWLEIMGSGMVHPAVFEAVGWDPERYMGYAFGMGPGRIAMLRHRIPDIRLLYDGEVAFLEQFA